MGELESIRVFLTAAELGSFAGIRHPHHRRAGRPAWRAASGGHDPAGLVDLAAGRLTEVLPDWSVPEIWLTLYYPPYERLPLKIATFSDVLETWVNETRPL